MVNIGIISGVVHPPELSERKVLETGSVSLVRYRGENFPALMKKFT
jgi:hypothetical protein